MTEDKTGMTAKHLYELEVRKLDDAENARLNKEKTNLYLIASKLMEMVRTIITNENNERTATAQKLMESFKSDTKERLQELRNNKSELGLTYNQNCQEIDNEINNLWTKENRELARLIPEEHRKDMFIDGGNIHSNPIRIGFNINTNTSQNTILNDISRIRNSYPEFPEIQEACDQALKLVLKDVDEDIATFLKLGSTPSPEQ